MMVNNLTEEIVNFVISKENETLGAWDNKMIDLIQQYGFQKVYDAYLKGVQEGSLSRQALANLMEMKD